jgi:preprotein translocase subunit SecD/SecD/SecF fusion protein
MARKKNASEESGVARWNSSEGAGSKGGGRSQKKKSAKRKMSPTTRRWASTLVILCVVLVVCVVGFTPLGERITQGLDIQGGVSVIMKATKSDGSMPSAEEMATATTIVQNRVNSLGASETSVQQQGTDSILIQIPGATNAEQAIQTVGRTGLLEFVRLDEIGDADALAKINAGTENVKLKEGTYTAFMDGSHISNVNVGQASNSATGYYAVNVKLDSEGSQIFADVTRELAPTKGRIAIVLDGTVNSAPAVQNEITGGEVSITGSFTLEDAQSLKTVLDSGSLPVTLTYSESRVVGPTLGQDSLNQGVFAIGIGVAIVVVYLFVFYRGLGILTMGSLGVFAVLYLGILALLSHFGAFALTLPGLAGIVLTTGSAADSSILVLERFREEIRMGRSIKNAAVSGAKHGIMTSLDADAVQMVAALALFFVAVGSVKGFGLTLALGIVCDVVTMFCFKAPALRLLALKAIPNNPKFWGVSQDLADAESAKEARAEKGGVANA